MNEHKLAPTDLIYYKEKVYFWIVLFFSIISYVLFAVSIIGLIIIICLFLLSFILHGIMIGQIRTNAVKLSPAQFPNIYKKVEDLCHEMELKKVPDVYVMQSGGVLNAFATRFFGKNMVVVYSEIFDLIEEGLEEELHFILAHELAHIKRNHLGKMAFMLPSMWIPGVAETYLRACEYTCDRYAAYYSGNMGASKNSLMMLAIGKKIFFRVDQVEYINQINQEKGFFVWLSEFLSTHPPLPKRIHAIQTYFSEMEPIILSKKSKMYWAFGSVALLIFAIFVWGLNYGLNAIESFDPFADIEAEEAMEIVDTPPIIEAAINGDIEKVKKLAKDVKDIDVEDYTGFTAMDWSIKAGNVEMVKTLLENGADPNNETSYGMTPLMTAAEKGKPDIVKLLHSAGADLDYQDIEGGMTPLIYAALGENEDTVKVLLELGADQDLKDYSNMTPYMHAIDTGYENIAKLLEPKKSK
ncbi:M48 family metallopeptidase [Metabacillus sp. Hm71]|uniref:M48 family metallopeptidase n=1 Tax=Metabacillus sp. Hm71 TaxID=3450743 RepID=UPI003F442794